MNLCIWSLVRKKAAPTPKTKQAIKAPAVGKFHYFKAPLQKSWKAFLHLWTFWSHNEKKAAPKKAFDL